MIEDVVKKGKKKAIHDEDVEILDNEIMRLRKQCNSLDDAKKEKQSWEIFSKNRIIILTEVQ